MNHIPHLMQFGVTHEDAAFPLLCFRSYLSFPFRHEKAISVKMFLLRLVGVGVSHFKICILFLRNKNETSQFVWLGMNLNV